MNQLRVKLQNKFSTSTQTNNQFLKKQYGMYSMGNEQIPQQNFIEVEDPKNQEILTRVYKCNKDDVNSVIQSAQNTFENGVWSQCDVRQRHQVLLNCRDVLRENISKFAMMESQQIGRPIKEMNAQLVIFKIYLRVGCRNVKLLIKIEGFEYFASLIRVQQGYTTPFKGDFVNYVERYPLGVVGQIIPWNHPLLITIKKLAPALAAGNSVVIKPSELAPCSVIELVDLLTHKAGVPKGVLNVIPGLGLEAGKALCEHPFIRKIDFTGGNETGKIVGEIAGKNIKSVVSELGGKTPMIVFSDVDIDSVVNGTVFGTFIAAGQTCIAGSRLIVHESIYDQFKSKLALKVSKIQMGDPQNLECQMGPVINGNQLDKIEKMVEGAFKQGAKALVGGKRDRSFKGYYFQPTVLEVEPFMDISQEEVFGPVVVIYKFKDELDAIKLANDSKFGLATSIWTNDIKLGHRVARKINAGIVWINDHHKNDPSSPWGGFKLSGIGRENGLEALHEYSQAKSIVVNYSNDPIDWFSTSQGVKRYS